MTDLKKEIDAKFNTEWVTTPIQWDGLDFNSPVDKKWIGLKFIPIDREQYAFGTGTGRNKDMVQLQVSCYGNSSTASLQTGDEVKEFIECWNFSTRDAKVELGVPDGLGIINLGNDIFESVLLFQINSYN